MKKNLLPQEIFDLYDDYVHSKIERRNFLDQLGKYAIGGLTVPAILQYLMPNYTDKQQVRAGDERLNSKLIQYNSPKGGGTIKGLLSHPIDKQKKITWYYSRT